MKFLLAPALIDEGEPYFGAVSMPQEVPQDFEIEHEGEVFEIADTWLTTIHGCEVMDWFGHARSTTFRSDISARYGRSLAAETEIQIWQLVRKQDPPMPEPEEVEGEDDWGGTWYDEDREDD